MRGPFVKFAASLFECVVKDSSTLHAMPLRQQSGESTHSLIMSNDVTAGRNVVEHLEQRAHHDQLTGLPNRYVLNDRLDQAISQAWQHGGSFALVFVAGSVMHSVTLIPATLQRSG
jgi:predicted signal transduction protein with EAL and GGDEF domain